MSDETVAFGAAKRSSSEAGGWMVCLPTSSHEPRSATWRRAVVTCGHEVWLRPGEAEFVAERPDAWVGCVPCGARAVADEAGRGSAADVLEAYYEERLLR